MICVKVYEVTGNCSINSGVLQADLVYRDNHDGTYHILKNRYGEHSIHVTAEELLIIVRDICVTINDD
jgi:hypothetical protein